MLCYSTSGSAHGNLDDGYTSWLVLWTADVTCLGGEACRVQGEAIKLCAGQGHQVVDFQHKCTLIGAVECLLVAASHSQHLLNVRG